MELNPDTTPWQTTYKLLIGSIVPRPIGWISTIDEHGQANLAPFSFFNAVGANPPHVMFSAMRRSTDGQFKDSLVNVQANGEFVVNIVTEGLVRQMNLSSTEMPPEISEFSVTRLEMAPSLTVRPPRVAASPIHFECKLVQVVHLGDGPGAGNVVIGRVTHLHVAEHVLMQGNRIDLERLKPVGRLAGQDYCRVTDIFEMERPPSRI